MKRLLSTILCLLLLLAVVSGCTGTQTTAGGTTAATTNTTTTAGTTTGTTAEKPSHTAIFKADPTDMEWKDDTSPITMTVYFGWPSFNFGQNSDVKWGNDKISKEITKRTGVTLEYIFDTEGEASKLKLMMSSGDKLPDYLFGSFTDSLFNNLREGEYLSSLTDLMDQYAPNMRKVLHKGEEEINGIDGKLWGIGYSAYGLDEPNEQVTVWWGCFAFRNDILESIGVTEIKTTDDLLTVLTKAKEAYPDVKYIAHFDPSTVFPFFQSFGGKGGSVAASGAELYYDAAADTVKFWFEDQDAGLSALKYMNKIYRTGCYNEEQMTLASDKMISELGQGNMFMVAGPNCWPIWGANTTLAAAGSKAYYRVLPPITAPGKKWHSMMNFTAQNGAGFSITADAKDPKRAITFMEFMVSDEGQALTMMGIEGEDYTTFVDQTTGLVFPKYQGDRLNLIGTPDFYPKTGINLWAWYLGAYFQFIDIRAGLMQKPDDLTSKLQLAATNAYTAKELANTTSVQMIGQMAKVPADSEAGRIRTKLDDFTKPQLTKIFLSKNDAEFNANYQALLDGIASLGIDTYRVAATASAKEFKTMMEKGGKVWTD